MDTAFVLDIVFAALLVLSVLIGAKRGLFKSLMSLAVIIAALIGASVLSALCTEPVTDIVFPLIGQSLADSLTSDTGAAGDMLTGVLSSDTVSNAGRAIVQTVVHAVLSLVFSIVLFIVLKLVTKALNALIGKIPVVNKVNSLGGAAIGLAECVLILLTVCYLAPHLGIGVLTENADSTHIVSFFMNHSPDSLIAILNH